MAENEDHMASRSQPCADAQERSPVDWDEVENEATAAMVRAAMPVLRQAADGFYAELLYSTEAFLADNVQFNLSAKLLTAERDAHDMRMKNLALERELRGLRNFHDFAMRQCAPSRHGTLSQEELAGIIFDYPLALSGGGEAVQLGDSGMNPRTTPKS